MASSFNPLQFPSSLKTRACLLQDPNKAVSSPAKTLNPEPKLVVNGGSTLSGHVHISGSKNSALPILAATLCCSGSSKLKNVPCLSDTRMMTSILESLGAQVMSFDGEIMVNTDGLLSVEPDSSVIGKLRGGFFVLGPLLARFGEATVGLPGGCDIGARPIDLYIHGLRALGATVELREGKVEAHVSNGKSLMGASFILDYPSVGATETLMMAACMAQGNTLISNAAQEPEIIDLAGFLTNCGAVVEGAGTDTIYINGRRRLFGSEYTIMADRIEAGTYMLAAAITRSCISMSPLAPTNLTCLVDRLSGAGCKIIQLGNDTLEFSAVPQSTMDDLQGFSIKTQPFPGFPTDLQPPTMALLSTCKGLSVVEESVFENRMGHVKELQKVGAEIRVRGNTALVFGKGNASRLRGCQVIATDLRGGMSLVLAGLAAEGITEISGISHVDRGYESLEIKLQNLGANVTRNNSTAGPC